MRQLRSRGITWRLFIAGLGLAALTLGGSVVPSAAAPGPAPAALVIVDSRVVPPGPMYIPPRTGNGDADFGGHGPKVDASAFLDGAFAGSTRLTVRVCMHAKETRSDFTEVAGCAVNVLIYQTPVGQCIQSVNLKTFDVLSYVDDDHSNDVFGPQVSESFVAQWEFVGDTVGNEAGTRTGVQIFTSALLVNIAPC